LTTDRRLLITAARKVGHDGDEVGVGAAGLATGKK
jgi:hypothetical protein